MKFTVVIVSFLISGLYAQFLITNSGPCSCDITINKCDSDCCCDTSCTAAQIQTFTCSNDLISPLSYGCFPTELLFQNNTPFLNAKVGSQYCVYQDNYTLRNFFVAPTVLTATVIGALTPANSMPTISTMFDAASASSAQQYLVGASISTVVQGESVGILAVSRPDVSGICVDGLNIGYLISEQSSCTRSLSNLQVDCRSLPSASSYYLTNMLVPSAPSAMLSIFPNGTNFSNSASFASVSCFACAPICAPCNLTITPAYNQNSSRCTNVITQVRYDIQGETNITSVNVSLTYDSVNSSFNQKFIVSFNKTGYNTSAPQRSGNPGYIVGYPVQSSKDSVNVQNMAIVSGGDCATGSTSPVLFGVNSFSDCTVQISNSSCPIASTSVNSSLSRFLPFYLLPYGNLTLTNLVPLTYADNSATAPNCSAITSVTIYIVFARTGTLTLPQNTIIGYQVALSYDTISNYANIQQYWVSVAVKFIDNSVTLFDLSGEVAKIQAKNTVKDFLYLLYVENGSPATAVTNVITLISSISLYMIILFVVIY